MVIFKATPPPPNISMSSLVAGNDLFNDFLQFIKMLVILGQISKT